MKRPDPVRHLALDVLRAVAERDAYANLELAAQLRQSGLSGRDAALATELVAGTLRLQGRYDAIIDQLVTGRLDAPVREALRLGAHQLLGMRVPTHAAVSTTVELVKARIGRRPTGLVNAVLRAIAARPLDEWLDGMSRADRSSHPEWVVTALDRALARPDELEALLAADNERPTVTLVARPGVAERAELGGTPLDISPYAVAHSGGDPGGIPAVAEGRAAVQDAGSQLVALALARAPLEGPDVHWLDMAAGPGGKAALLASLAAERASSEVGSPRPRLLAADRHEHRARLVADATRAVSAGLAGIIVADGTRPAWPPERFDRVLLDAPCSGLGALRRRPESRWRRRPDDLHALVPLQRELLAAAVASVRPGGVVAYATCSPVVTETADVVKGLLADRADIVVIDATAVLPEAVDAESAHLPGAVQLWPHRHGTDAMFLALLRRVG